MRSLALALAACSGSPPPAAPFCPKAGAALCADFEASADPGAGFTGVIKHGMATGAVDTGTFVVRVPDDATVSSAFAPYLETSETAGEIEIDFSFRAESLPAIVTIAVVQYQQDQYAAGVQIANHNLYVIEQRMGIIDSPWFVGRVATGEWHSYALVVSPTRRVLEAKIDGQALTFPVGANQKFTLAGKKTLSIGIADSSATLPATAVDFDDVTFFVR